MFILICIAWAFPDFMSWRSGGLFSTNLSFVFEYTALSPPTSLIIGNCLLVWFIEPQGKAVPASPAKSEADTSFDPQFEPIIELPPEVKVVTGNP